MSEEEVSTHHSNAGEVFLITKDDGLYLDAVEAVDLSALAWDQDVPFVDSIKHGLKVLETLLGESPRILGCLYQLDGLQFGEMRSSVLRAGIVVLAVQAGHQAIIAPTSTRLPAANWRSEFIFRASRGIRLLKPDIAEQELLRLVTSEIQFYEEHVARDGDTHPASWQGNARQNISSARF